MPTPTTSTDAPEPPPLLNTSGEIFTALSVVGPQLSSLANDDRVQFRNANANAIATTASSHVLIVAGPGAGKSFLFMGRIEHWLAQHPGNQIFVSTFVRKLIRDLRADLDKLPIEKRSHAQANTVHGLARSLISLGEGSEASPRASFVRVVDQRWAGVVWSDALALQPDMQTDSFPYHSFQHQHYTEAFEVADGWPAVRDQYEQVTRFYNAVGFADSITIAIQVVQEEPGLIAHQLWIVDEYQDLNQSEDHLIRTVTESALGVLLAGDDDQALYQSLKASTPDTIVGYYNDQAFAKAMLPYCSRCDFHICNAAAEFIGRHRAKGSIDKLFLPLKVEPDTARVKVVGTAQPTAAVDYVRKFMEDHTNDYAAYLEDRAAGIDTDPFLLVLSQSGVFTMKKSHACDTELERLVAEYTAQADQRSFGYLTIAAHCASGWYPMDNFALRKVLHYTNDVTVDEVHGYLREALDTGQNLWTVLISHRPDITARIETVTNIVDSDAENLEAVVLELSTLLDLGDLDALVAELTLHPIRRGSIREEEDQEAIETADLVDPVALMSIVGSKGLSAHHVMVIGCDSLNMQMVSPLAFFVAMTRARRSLHLITSKGVGGEPHEFLSHISADSAEYLWYTKGSRSAADVRSWAGLSRKFEAMSYVIQKRKKS